MPTPMPSFNSELATRGHEILALLVQEAQVHDFYTTGTLFGAATSEPRASISVPLTTWDTLPDENRTALAHYVASLVEEMRANPLVHSQIPEDAPAADLIRSYAQSMGPRSWVIFGGRVDGQDILTDTAVASGAEIELSSN